MAKKKEAATSEQRLQEALVPCTEWPYKLPENWCWTYICSGYNVTSSKRVHKNDWLSKGIPFYRTRELVKLSTKGFVDNELFISEDMYETFKNEYGVPDQGDLLISGVGTIGVPYVVDSDKKFYFKDGNIIWFKSKGLFLPQYTYYLYKSQFIDNQIHDMSAGTTVDTYTIINANSTKIPLPPLPEQQRIVERIESLFAQLDEAKEKAQAALDSFEPRKAAILHKAFIGDLTAKWREEHGIMLDSWKQRKLSDIARLQSGIMKGKHNEGPTVELPYLRVANVQDGFLKLDEMKQIQVEVSKVDRYKLQKGDVLFTEGGDFDKLGRGTVWEGEIENCLHQNHVFAVRPNVNLLNPYFLSTQAGSRYGKAYFLSCAKQTTNLASINSTQLKNFPVLVPTLSEQQEIVRILDSLLAKEQQAKEAAEAVLEQIDLIKKSILSRAFRGELGTNDPNEESATELLKEILEKGV